VNIEEFPKLAALYINCAEDVVVQVLQPHATIKKLSIKTTGNIRGLSDLNDRYPLLMDLRLHGKVDVKDIPTIPLLKNVEVIPFPLVKFRKKWLKKCRNLVLFNGRSVKLDQKWFN